MSGDNTEGKCSFAFEEYYYNPDNYDDYLDLEARLYYEQIYESNIEATGSQKTTKIINSTAVVTNVELERAQNEPEPEQSLTLETDKDSQKMQSTDRSELDSTNISADREMNPAYGYDNENSEAPLITQGNQGKENVSKKHKSPKRAKNTHQESSENDTIYSRYNIVSKCMKQKTLLTKQTDQDKDSSDSEESIFEVPVPPKQPPLLIDLENSDEEIRVVDEDDLKKCGNNVKNHLTSPFINSELEIPDASSSQDTSFRGKNVAGSYDKNTVNPGTSTQTSIRTQEVAEDIVLNCTTIQRGVTSISEIRQLSKSAKVNQGSKSTEDTNQNSKRTSPQDKSKRDNENAQQGMFVAPGRKQQTRQQNADKSNMDNLRYTGQDKTSGTELCNSVNDRKRCCNNEVEQSKQKRQCTVQENNKDVLQRSDDGNRKFFVSNDSPEPMPEEMRYYYNSSCGQDFDVNKLQQGMPKDPRMWTILDEDIMPCPRLSGSSCTNCHKFGHRRYDCQAPRRSPTCYMCGMKDHTEVRCPQKMCLTCGKRQNTFSNTCDHCRVLYCTMCNSTGHSKKQCPDLWRRYHQTIDMSNAPQDPGNVIKPSRLLYCCNCTKRGHESSTCRAYRWSEFLPTPAVVTNYMDGPTYTPSSPRASCSSDPEPKIGLVSGARENKTSVAQNAIDMKQTVIENVKSSTNTLSSHIDFCISPISQEVGRNLKTAFRQNVANDIWPIENIAFKSTTVYDVTFNRIIHSYGVFHNKNHKDARMIVQDLNSLFISPSMFTTLASRKVAPTFLNMFENKIEFQVKIGFFAYQIRPILSVQLLAMKECIEFLYNLLEYWFSLPDDEKDYGIDVNLPINTIKMFNVLNSRIPQLEKMTTCTPTQETRMETLRQLCDDITTKKAQLKQYKYKEGKKQASLANLHHKYLIRLQIKLLMIVNVEPRGHNFIHIFQNVMRKFELNRYKMNERLDNATYLRLILLYNHIFVPHTPIMIHRVLHDIWSNDLLPMQQKSETAVREQGNFMYNDCSSSAASCTPQNVNPEDFSAIDNQQNNEMLVEKQDETNTSLEMNETMNYKYDLKVTIKNNLAQNSQFVPLNTEPVSIQLEDPGRFEDKLSKNVVEIESGVSEIKKDKKMINVLCNPPLSKRERKKRLKAEKRKQKERDLILNINNIASNLIIKARTFGLPHIMKAADETQRQINNRTIRPKHVKMLDKLIQLEESYQKKVNTCCGFFKK